MHRRRVDASEVLHQDSQLPSNVTHFESNRDVVFTSRQALVKVLLSFNPFAASPATGLGRAHHLAHRGASVRRLAMFDVWDRNNDEEWVELDHKGKPKVKVPEEEDEYLSALRAAAKVPAKTLNNTGMVAHSPKCLAWGNRITQKGGSSNYYVADVEVSHGYQDKKTITTEFTTSHRLQFSFQIMRIVGRIRRAPVKAIDPGRFAEETLRFLAVNTTMDLCDPDWEFRPGAENVPFTPDFLPGRPLFEWYPDLYKYLSDTLLPDWPRIPDVDPNLHEKAIRSYKRWYMLDDDLEVTIKDVNCSKISIEEWAQMDGREFDEASKDDFDDSMDEPSYGALSSDDVLVGHCVFGDFNGPHFNKEGRGEWWNGKFK